MSGVGWGSFVLKVGVKVNLREILRGLKKR